MACCATKRQSSPVAAFDEGWDRNRRRQAGRGASSQDARLDLDAGGHSAAGEFMMRYLVFIRRTRTGYSVDVPDLPGCVATATNIEHARQMIAEAIEMHLQMMQQQGEVIPQPSTETSFSVD